MFTRLLEEKDRPLSKELWGYAFEKDEPFYSWYFKDVFDPKNSVGIFLEETLMSCLHLNPYTLHLNGNSFETSYVVGVITRPEYRSKGAMKVLLSKAIEEMYKRNHYVSILMPFDTTFYQKYGWELCYSEIKYQIPMNMLKNLSKPYGSFYPVGKKDYESLERVYKNFLEHHHGYVKRSPKNWENILKDLSYGGGYAYLLKDEDTPIGYILYLLKEDKFVVLEMAYANIRAKKSIFAFIESHHSQGTKVEWSAPMDDHTYLFLRDTIKPKPTNNIKIHPFMCGRVIHVEKALEHCVFSKKMNTSFRIKITDPYAHWNNKTFFVTIKKGIPSIEESQDLPDMECSINTFSQLFFGTIDIKESLWLEKIILHNESLLDSLENIFYKKNNYIHEFF